MQVVMKNPRTGQLRDVKIGWSWTLFLFSHFFGLPLFLRKLNMWGCVFLVLTAISVGLGFVFPSAAGLENVRHTSCYTSFLQRIQAKAR